MEVVGVGNCRAWKPHNKRLSGVLPFPVLDVPLVLRSPDMRPALQLQVTDVILPANDVAITAATPIGERRNLRIRPINHVEFGESQEILRVGVSRFSARTGATTASHQTRNVARRGGQGRR
jgi:hypothetical protein